VKSNANDFISVSYWIDYMNKFPDILVKNRMIQINTTMSSEVTYRRGAWSMQDYAQAERPRRVAGNSAVRRRWDVWDAQDSLRR
jgi:hypothetical protein